MCPKDKLSHFSSPLFLQKHLLHEVCIYQNYENRLPYTVKEVHTHKLIKDHLVYRFLERVKGD